MSELTVQVSECASSMGAFKFLGMPAVGDEIGIAQHNYRVIAVRHYPASRKPAPYETGEPAAHVIVEA